MTKTYVYVLIDPRKQNKVFYVGKGKGARTTHHIKETKQELFNLATDSHKDVSDALINIKNLGLTDKQALIAELLEQKYTAEDICRVVAIFDTDEEAFACESLLIHYVYGLNNLSNIQAGQKSSRFRLHGCWDLIESLDYPLIIRDERSPRNRRDDVEAELKRHEEYGLISIINQIANEVKGEWDSWAIRGAFDVSRQLLVKGAGNHKYKIKLWGKPVGDGYICTEMRGNKQAMDRLRNDLAMGNLIRRDNCFYPLGFGSKGPKTKEIKELKRRLKILENIAQTSNINMLSPEARNFLQSIKK